jgi:rhodanese-related sulfurtransferase
MSQMTKEISGKSTMQDVLEAYPSARRALFQRYHIGGCSSCGFSPTDSLEEVLANHNVMDVDGTIEYLKESQKVDDRMKITPQELQEALKNGNAPKLIDVRDQWEYDIAHIEGAQLLSRPLIGEMMESWAKDSFIVFTCHRGMRSLDAASYFIGHGFTNVRSLEGGVDRWAEEIDTQMARY